MGTLITMSDISGRKKHLPKVLKLAQLSKIILYESQAFNDSRYDLFQLAPLSLLLLSSAKLHNIISVAMAGVCSEHPCQ